MNPSGAISGQGIFVRKNSSVKQEASKKKHVKTEESSSDGSDSSPSDYSSDSDRDTTSIASDDNKISESSSMASEDENKPEDVDEVPSPIQAMRVFPKTSGISIAGLADVFHPFTSVIAHPEIEGRQCWLLYWKLNMAIEVVIPSGQDSQVEVTFRHPVATRQELSLFPNAGALSGSHEMRKGLFSIKAPRKLRRDDFNVVENVRGIKLWWIGLENTTDGYVRAKRSSFGETTVVKKEKKDKKKKK